LDGEVVVCAKDGAIFDALHRQGTVRAAILQTFDLLELNGEDLRPLMIGKRKAHRAKFLARAPPGIEFNAHTDEDGAPVFPARLRDGLGGDRVETADRSVPVGASGGAGPRRLKKQSPRPVQTLGYEACIRAGTQSHP
jgi:hypothetical protein